MLVQAKEHKSAVEALDQVFAYIATSVEPADRETAYFYLGYELKNELKLSDYACKALKLVSPDHSKFKEARQELAELFFYDHLLSSADPVQSLDETDIENDLKENHENNRFKALEFALQSGNGELATRFRTQVVNTLYDSPLDVEVTFLILLRFQTLLN